MNQKETENELVYREEYCYPLSITQIELIGYAKNNIIEARELMQNLSPEYSHRLSQAYALLDEVQEYLYES